MSNLANYRIKRINSRNVTIQKQMPAGYWVIESYHGNSPFSLVSGLLELIMSKVTPKTGNLQESLEMSLSEVVSMRDDLEEMIRERMEV